MATTKSKNTNMPQTLQVRVVTHPHGGLCASLTPDLGTWPPRASLFDPALLADLGVAYRLAYEENLARLNNDTHAAARLAGVNTLTHPINWAKTQ